MDTDKWIRKPSEGPRRTQGEGVPATRRKGPEKVERAADPPRGRETGLHRMIDRKPTARDREGL
jgi:hypothetical protein